MCDAGHFCLALSVSNRSPSLSATCPTPGRSLGARLRRAAGISRPIAALVASTALFGLAPTVASAANADEVQLTGVFAAPISGTEKRCTPEPNDRYLYDTFETYNPSAPGGDTRSYGLPGSSTPYVAGNWPSSGDVTKSLQAGATNDLCFGFTLSPNVEPFLVRTAGSGNKRRRQDTPPAADIQGTHVDDELAHDDLKTSTITMPAGFAGAPDWASVCSAADFGAGNYGPAQCDANTMAGTVFGRVTANAKNDPDPSVSGLTSMVVEGGLANPTSDPIKDLGYVYNLEHGPNELARLGISIQPLTGVAPAKFAVGLKLAPDGRVQATVDNAPRQIYSKEFTTLESDPEIPQYDPSSPEFGKLVPGAVPSQIYLESIAIRAWGSKVDHPTMPQDFAQWGTDCTNALKANVSIETYLGAKSALDSNSFTMTGCDTLPFLPDLEVTTTEKKPGVPTGVNVKLELGQTNSGPKSALLKDAEVTLPAGLEIGAQVATSDSGLKLCSAAQFAKDSSAANTCPAGSKQGKVTIVTPLLSRNFEGNVYLGEQAAVGELPPLYLEASPTGATAADAPRIKLEGKVKVDENGNLTTTFADAPQLRFSELRLEFPSGDNALFTTPRKCGIAKGTSQFTSWAKPTEKKPVESEINIDQDCTTPGFEPTFKFESANNAVGVSSPTKITISREDRSPWLKDVKVALPPGFLADLKLATECSKADAAAGACPESSRMGTVTTVAGAGAKPLSLSGSMYLVERNEGSVAGVVIVVDAKIGELQLGKVVVPGDIKLGALDASLTMATSAPLRFKGIALNLRSIIVNLDRENFPLNPTACGPLKATADLAGDGDEKKSLSSDVTFAGCAGLPFQPGFKATLSGETGAKGHPTLDVSMTPRAGDSNMKSATVMLPKGVSTDLDNLKNVCALDAFNAGGCPDNTKVGTVAAKVSITNDVIAGTVHLVRIEGTALPGIGMNFTGRYAVRVLSKVRLNPGDLRVITEFGSIPDLPLRQLDLHLDGGPKSPLLISPAACTAPTTWETTLGGQGGQTHKITTPVKCGEIGPKPDVNPAQSVSWSAKSGLKYTVSAPSGATLQSAKLTLPKGFKLNTSKKGKKAIKVTIAPSKTGKAKLQKTGVAVTGTGDGPTKITITIKPGGYKLPAKYKGKLKKKTKLQVSSRVVVKGQTTAVAKKINATVK